MSLPLPDHEVWLMATLAALIAGDDAAGAAAKGQAVRIEYASRFRNLGPVEKQPVRKGRGRAADAALALATSK